MRGGRCCWSLTEGERERVGLLLNEYRSQSSLFCSALRSGFKRPASTRVRMCCRHDGPLVVLFERRFSVFSFLPPRGICSKKKWNARGDEDAAAKESQSPQPRRIRTLVTCTGCLRRRKNQRLSHDCHLAIRSVFFRELRVQFCRQWVDDGPRVGVEEGEGRAMTPSTVYTIVKMLRHPHLPSNLPHGSLL